MNPYEPPKTKDVTPSFLNAKLKAAICPHCGHSFSGVAKKSFLGFQKFSCPNCSKEFTYPLFRGYRITYWILLAVALGFMLSSGGRPNIFFVLMSIAVMVDAYKLWERMKTDPVQESSVTPAAEVVKPLKIWLFIVGVCIFGTCAAMFIPALAGQPPQLQSVYAALFSNGVFFYLWWKQQGKKPWQGTLIGIFVGLVAFALASFISGVMRHA